MNNFPELFEGHYDYLLREVLESIDDSVLVFDKKFKIIYANEAAEAVFNGTKSRLTGKNIKQLVPKYRKAYFDQRLSKLNASSKHEIQLEGKTGFIGMRASDQIFYAEGKLANFKRESAYILVLRDITLRKAVENELETALEHLRKIGSKVAYRLERPSIMDEFPED